MSGGALVTAKHRFSAYNRRRKAAFAVDFARRLGVRTVLLVGVDGSRDRPSSPTPTTNLVERALEDALPRVVACGLASSASGWAEYVQADALDLPFGDDEFDLVYSNAVIEHVGQAEDQRQFVREHVRVGRHWAFTTPNRLFPIESHTMTLIRHMDPSWRPSRPAYTRLLSPSDLRAIIPVEARIHGGFYSPTLTVSSR